MDGRVYLQAVNDVDKIANFSIPENATGNNSCNIIITAQSTNASGNVEMLLAED